MHMMQFTHCKERALSMAPWWKFNLKFKERVLQYAQKNSGEKATSHFDIESGRVRYWKKTRKMNYD